VVAVNVAFSLLVAYPGFALAHHHDAGQIQIYSTKDIPESAGPWAANLIAEMASTPLPLDHGTYNFYITNGGWTEKLYFLPTRVAGGLVYPMNRRAVFLSGADFSADRLIKGDNTMTPPRTLTYYGVHELTHLTHMAAIGRLNYLLQPTWVREGLADYAALGPADPATIAAVTSWTGRRLPLMQTYGSYPEFRVQFTQALATRSLQDLLTLNRLDTVDET